MGSGTPSIVAWGVVVLGLAGCTTFIDASFEEAHLQTCEPLEVVACYGGPTGTAGVGVCKSGEQTCSDTGEAFGPCVGEVWPGIEDALTIPDESCDGLTGNHVWSRSFGNAAGKSYDVRSTQSLGVDAQGNVFIGGYFHLSAGFGPFAYEDEVYQTHGFVAKLDPSGEPVWAKFFDAGDAPGHQSGVKDLAVDGEGNVVIMGEFYGTPDFGDGPLEEIGGGGTGYLVKLDPAGNHLWSQAFGGGGGATPLRVATSASGDIAVAGYFHHELHFYGGQQILSPGQNMFVVKLDANGEYRWSQAFPQPQGAGVTQGVAIDSQGDVVFDGSFIDAAFGEEVENFVVKLDGDTGDKVWSASVGPTKIYNGGALTLTPDDDVIVAKTFKDSVGLGGETYESAGSDDILVARLKAASGDTAWARQYGDAEMQQTFRIATDPSGYTVLVGRFNGELAFGDLPKLTSLGLDAYVVKMRNDDGTPVWARSFGDDYDVSPDPGQGGEIVDAVAVDPDHNVLLGGHFDGTVSFGGTPLEATAEKDVVVVKLAP